MVFPFIPINIKFSQIIKYSHHFVRVKGLEIKYFTPFSNFFIMSFRFLNSKGCFPKKID